MTDLQNTPDLTECGVTNEKPTNVVLMPLRKAAARAIETIKLNKKPGRSKNIEGLWSFLGLEDAPVEVVAFNPGNWIPKGSWSKLRSTMAVTYVTSGAAACGMVVEGGDDNSVDDGPPAESLWGTGYYLVPATLRRGVEARYPVGEWSAAGELTKEKDVTWGRVLAVDCDPGRPSQTNSTNREFLRSMAVGVQAQGLLRQVGVPEEALAYGSSGNGCHVLIALDIPWSDEQKALRARLLAGLGQLLNLEADGQKPSVTIDQSMADGPRYIPLYGTMKKKGPAHEGRPQRRTFLQVPDGRNPLGMAELQRVVEQLERLSGTPDKTPESLAASSSPRVPSAKAPRTRAEGGPGAPEYWEALKAVPIAEVMTWQGLSAAGGKLTCPGCQNTEGANTLDKIGRNLWKCHHDTCSSKGSGKGCYDTVGIVMEVQGCERREAARLVSEHFDIPAPKRGKGRPRKRVTSEHLEELAAVAEVDLDGPLLEARPLTDLGNAERLVAAYGDHLRYVAGWKCWLCWTGTHWSRDDTGEAVRLAHATARNILAEAARCDDDESRAQVADWAKTSESRSRTEAMLRQAEPLVCITTDQLDRQKLKLNAQNGTVDLETGELLPHNPLDYFTIVSPVPYEPYDPARAELWEACLGTWQPDPEVRGFLARLLGCSALGEVREHLLPVHVGAGRNGKGTFFEILIHVLGGYATSIPEELLVETRGSEHPTLVATLFGKRLCVASETAMGSTLAVNRLKRLSGGDTITCRRMREDYWEFRPTHLLHLQTNNVPRVPDTGVAIWSRMLLVQWGVTIPDEDQDKTLPAKLREVGSDVLGWLVQGSIEYLRGGLQTPESVRKATQEWRADEDIVGQFLAERCQCWPADEQGQQEAARADEQGWYQVTKSILYAAYSEWVHEGGQHPVGQRRFRSEILKRGFEEGREAGTGVRLWLGLALTGSINCQRGARDIEADDDFLSEI